MWKAWRLIALGITLCAYGKAFATLGESYSSAARDQQIFHGEHIANSAGAYTVHQITSQGETIKEFVNANGLVFAVTWRGLAHPNLSQLLGSHFSEYKQAAANTVPPAGRVPYYVQTPNIVVMKAGHMRDVHGRAYLNALVPNGVNPEVLQ